MPDPNPLMDDVLDGVQPTDANTGAGAGATGADDDAAQAAIDAKLAAQAAATATGTKTDTDTGIDFSKVAKKEDLKSIITDEKLLPVVEKMYDHYTGQLTSAQEKLKKSEQFIDIVEMYEKDPTLFAMQFLPQEFEKIDPNLQAVTIKDGQSVKLPKPEFDALLSAKLVDETGKLTFDQNPLDMNIPGTPTYQFQKVLARGVATIEEFRSKAKNNVEAIKNASTAKTAKFNANLVEAKAYAMKEYGVTEEDFKTLVEEPLSKMSDFSITKFVDFMLLDKVVEKRVSERKRGSDIADYLRNTTQSPAPNNLATNDKIDPAVKKFFEQSGIPL